MNIRRQSAPTLYLSPSSQGGVIPPGYSETGNRVIKLGYVLTITSSRSPVEIGLKALRFSLGDARGYHADDGRTEL